MLFYIFFTFQIFYYVSSDISCYDTLNARNIFNYIVTVDHFPVELQNSSLKTNCRVCNVEIVWRRGPDYTQMTLIAEDKGEPRPPEHKLQVAVGYEARGMISFWEQVIMYQCYTDQCNSLTQIKRLLNSLTINDDLADLTNLLIPIVPFQGEWCYRFSNATFTQCNTTIPNDLCRQCQLTGQMNETGTELCATCSIEEEKSSLLEYQMIFNLLDQTSFSNWMIHCRHDHCSTPTVGDSIHQRSSIDFDYEKFVHNRREKMAMNKIILLLMVFLLISFQ